MIKNNFQYYVEGETEEKFFKYLQSEDYIYRGKIVKWNVIERPLKKAHIRVLKENTIIVLVFDTDTGKVDTLEENIRFLSNEKWIAGVYCIAQVKNLEDEIVRCSNIHSINEVFNTKNRKEHKAKMLNCKNLSMVLNKIGLNKDKLWTKEDFQYIKFMTDREKIIQ